jgi:hypothetical protein
VLWLLILHDGKLLSITRFQHLTSDLHPTEINFHSSPNITQRPSENRKAHKNWNLCHYMTSRSTSIRSSLVLGLTSAIGPPFLHAPPHLSSCSSVLHIKMATGTRNPLTRRVLPDKKVGVELVLYPWVR